MIDKETIYSEFDIVEKDLEFLGEFKGMTEEDFPGSYKNIQSVVKNRQ